MIEVEELKDIETSLLKELTKLEKKAFGEGGLSRWTLPPIVKYGKVFLLREDRKLVGLAELIRVWEDKSKAYLVGFSVKKGYRLQGLGAKFLDKVIERLKAYSIQTLYLTVSPDNKAAIKLYKKFGFVEEGFKEDFYGEGEERLFLVKNMADK